MLELLFFKCRNINSKIYTTNYYIVFWVFLAYEPDIFQSSAPRIQKLNSNMNFSQLQDNRKYFQSLSPQVTPNTVILITFHASWLNLTWKAS